MTKKINLIGGLSAFALMLSAGLMSAAPASAGTVVVSLSNTNVNQSVAPIATNPAGTAFTSVNLTANASSIVQGTVTDASTVSSSAINALNLASNETSLGAMNVSLVNDATDRTYERSNQYNTNSAGNSASTQSTSTNSQPAGNQNAADQSATADALYIKTSFATSYNPALNASLTSNTNVTQSSSGGLSEMASAYSQSGALSGTGNSPGTVNNGTAYGAFANQPGSMVSEATNLVNQTQNKTTIAPMTVTVTH